MHEERPSGANAMIGLVDGEDGELVLRIYAATSGENCGSGGNGGSSSSSTLLS